MQLKYTPEGADPRVWAFDPDKLMSSEAEAIEKVTRMTYREFGEAVQSGSITALHALLWVFLKRTEPTLRYEQVEFASSAVSLDYDAHELKEMRDQIQASTKLTDAERVDGLNTLDELIADAEVAVPKATASSAASTG